MKSICVFASSSDELAPIYNKAAKELGELIAKEGFGIVFGAGTDGLMGHLARGAAEQGGHIVGVIPDVLNLPGIVHEKCSEVVDTRTMHEGKAVMEARSDAFVALPGGFGTLEEILEMITFKQLGIHNKPIALLNTNGFFSHLIAQFDEIVQQRFAASGVRTLFAVFDDVRGVMDYIKNYDPTNTYKKHVFLEKE